MADPAESDNGFPIPEIPTHSEDRILKSGLTASEAKRRRRLRDQLRSKCRIAIGNQMERWKKLGEDIGPMNNEKIAKILLDKYYEEEESTLATTSARLSQHFSPAKRKRPLNNYSYITASRDESDREYFDQHDGAYYPSIAESLHEEHELEEDSLGMTVMDSLIQRKVNRSRRIPPTVTFHFAIQGFVY